MEFRLCPGAPPPVCGTGEARPHLSLLADAITAGEAQERNGEPSLFFYMHGMHAARRHRPRAFSEIVVVGKARLTYYI